MPSPASKEMGDHTGVQLRVQEIYPSVGRCSDYQPKGSDAVQLGSKGRYGSCLVAGKTVWTVV